MNKYKPKSCVWEYFSKIDGPNACNFCQRTISESAARMKYHLLNVCLEVPDAVKVLINREKKCSKPEEERPSSSLSISSNSSSSNLLGYVDFMTNQERGEIDSLISKLIFKANLPFLLVENDDFKNLLKRLKPSYPGISRKVLSERHLDEEYLKVKEATEKAINESMGLTLQIDGWSNVNRSPIINVIACTPVPFFVKSYNTGSESHTSDFLSKIVEEQIETLGRNKCVAVITDNARNMALMRQLIKDKYPAIQEFGCAAHGLNLILQDICQIEEINKLIELTESVVKEVTQSNIRSSLFNELSNGKTKRLVSRNRTRWYTTLNMLQSVYNAKDVLGQMAFRNSMEKTKEIIFDRLENFWEPLNQLIKLLKPINKAIGLIESDNSIVSDLPKILNELIAEMTTITDTHFKDNEVQIFAILENRRDFMETDFHYFANIIDPRYCGASLSNYQKELGFSFFDNYIKLLDLGEEEHNVLMTFQKFRTKSGSFKHKFLWKESFTKSPYL